MTEATKHDAEKPRWDLLPWGALTEVVAVYTKGAAKYGDHNWRLGMAWSRVVAALLRHLTAWLLGEERDEETGCHHLASVVWCGLTLLEYALLGIGKDDRVYRRVDNDA